MTEVSRFGITIDAPIGWEAAIFRRPATHGESTQPVAHLGSFGLPPDRGDFGSGAVDVMSVDDVLLTLVEYDRSSATTALFSNPMPTALAASDFSPRTLQRVIPGHAGTQRFFTVPGRAFCLYAVVGSWDGVARLVDRVNAGLASITVEAFA